MLMWTISLNLSLQEGLEHQSCFALIRITRGLRGDAESGGVHPISAALNPHLWDAPGFGDEVLQGKAGHNKFGRWVCREMLAVSRCCR